MIEGLENPAGGDGLGVFGKELKKKRRLSDTLKALSGLADDPMEDPNSMFYQDLSADMAMPEPGRGSAPMYDPSRLYGRMYQMYGGRRVRGGLLGE
jgi:hypothetical protein